MAVEPFDDRDWQAAMDLYQKATKRDMVDVLTRAFRNYLFKAARYTRPALKRKIDKHSPTEGGNGTDYANRLFYTSPINKVPKGSGRRAKAIQIFNSRHRTRGYIKAGFFAILRRMGISTRVAPSRQLQSASDYKPAKFNRLVVEGVNGAIASGDLAQSAANKAMKETARDMVKYALKKMQTTADEFSA